MHPSNYLSIYLLISGSVKQRISAGSQVSRAGPITTSSSSGNLTDYQHWNYNDDDDDDVIDDDGDDVVDDGDDGDDDCC